MVLSTQIWTTCGSSRLQSPINLDTSRARRTNASFKLYNEEKRVPAFTYNNGHVPHFSVKLNETKKNITLKLHNVSERNPYEEYVLADLHIYLGKEKDNGSEHSIDGKFFPMKAHMVFYNSKYVNIGEAKPKKDGLVVIGVLIKVNKRQEEDNYNDDDENDGDVVDDDDDDDDDDNEDDEEGEHEYEGVEKERSEHESRECKVRFARTLSYLMEKYYEKIKEYHHTDEEPKETENPEDLQCGERSSDETIRNECVRSGGHPNETYDVHSGISPADVLPFDQRFYTYQGSLTTPPCYETVQWIVYKCPISVSRKAFKALQQVEDAEKKPLNYHVVQRPIKKNEFFNVSKNF